MLQVREQLTSDTWGSRVQTLLCPAPCWHFLTSHSQSQSVGALRRYWAFDMTFRPTAHPPPWPNPEPEPVSTFAAPSYTTCLKLYGVPSGVPLPALQPSEAEPQLHRPRKESRHLAHTRTATSQGGPCSRVSLLLPFWRSHALPRSRPRPTTTWCATLLPTCSCIILLS